ncbi:hypothetical protein RHSIM_Rhsim05G0145900 [Rhododendron simsii]|uniref:Uncharacterized protein n=1 Tax=Rhododendron simsii TaxID=118357 RepID=A0A834GZU0_RHOSS|nr:hypothetical protein RHSIM_Rhsim05G0145900 [Rhododendron simsii]
MDEELEDEEKVVAFEDFSSSYYSCLPYSNIPIPNPVLIFWSLTKLICFQLLTQAITNCVSILLSPIFFLHSLVSESVHRAGEAKESVESTVHAAGRVILFPSTGAARKSVRTLVKKVGVGFVGALYACMAVTVVMALAIALGVGLVHVWAEEPVLVREKLSFDYTHVHPNAVFLFRGGRGRGGGFINLYGKNMRKMGRLVPVGHTFCVSLFLLMPESDYNLQIGIFQARGVDPTLEEYHFLLGFVASFGALAVFGGARPSRVARNLFGLRCGYMISMTIDRVPLCETFKSLTLVHLDLTAHFEGGLELLLVWVTAHFVDRRYRHPCWFSGLVIWHLRTYHHRVTLPSDFKAAAAVEAATAREAESGAGSSRAVKELRDLLREAKKEQDVLREQVA